MGFSSGDDSLEKKENQVPLRTEDVGCSVGVDGDHGVEPESEFKPIDHPLEPSAEDHPVKCPVPDSSTLNDGEIERFTESMRRRAEIPSVDDQSMLMVAIEPPARAVRKRQHTITFDHTMPPLFREPPLPPLPTHSQSNTVLFQVLQQCNEFES